MSITITRRNILYVGGLHDSVTEEIVHAAFIPFGDLKSIQLPRDFTANKHRGFAFVEYEDEDDASDAIENMDGSEIFGRVVRCSIAKAIPKLTPGKAVWNTEEWIQKSITNNFGNVEGEDLTAEITLIPNKTEDDDEDMFVTNIH